MEERCYNTVSYTSGFDLRSARVNIIREIYGRQQCAKMVGLYICLIFTAKSPHNLQLGLRVQTYITYVASFTISGAGILLNLLRKTRLLLKWGYGR